jgi:hypothetical protein
MTDLTDALLTRRAAIHGLIRSYVDEIGDIDRLLARHAPTFEPTIGQAAFPPWVMAGVDWGPLGTPTLSTLEAAVARAAMQTDDRPPADVPHVEQVAVAEAGVEPAPDGLPRPTPPNTTPSAQPDPTAPFADLVITAAQTKTTPHLKCKHPGCDRTFSTRQSLGGHMARGHRDTPPVTPPPDTSPATPRVVVDRGPAQMPAEGGRVVRCETCGWQTSPSRLRDLAKHTHLEHHRAPERTERTPIIDERAA